MSRILLLRWCDDSSFHFWDNDVGFVIDKVNDRYYIFNCFGLIALFIFNKINLFVFVIFIIAIFILSTISKFPYLKNSQYFSILEFFIGTVYQYGINSLSYLQIYIFGQKAKLIKNLFIQIYGTRRLKMTFRFKTGL